MENNKNLIKAVSMYLFYFVYTYLASYLVSVIPSINEYVILIVFDVIFLGIITFCYKDDLKDKWKELKSKYKFKKIFLIVLLSVLLILLLNILMGAITTALFPNIELVADQNTSALVQLASMSAVYTIFKTMIFSIVAEELLFRQSLSNCIKNNVLFVVISALVYTAMNFIFTGAQLSFQLVLEMTIYFIPALLFSAIYVKYNRNIFIVMFIKFFYNLIPLALLFIAI